MGVDFEPRFTTSGDAVGTEYHGHIHALHPETDEHLGTLSYAYDGGRSHDMFGQPTGHEPSIAIRNIEVAPQWRRQGIGTALGRRLQEEFAGQGLDFSPGMTTDDGTAFYNALQDQGMRWSADGTTDTLAILSAVIKDPLPPLPPRSQRLGATRVLWWEANPGEAVIMATGGTVDDRAYAEQLVKIQLGPHSYRRVGFTINAAQKTGQWADIMAKAKRLIQSNQVTVLRNGYNNIVGHVIGDHGEYNVEIGRDDPNSQAITTWNCECPWDQFAFQRTRKWKKYEARPCAHVLALYWKAKSTPLDEDVTQQQQQTLGPGQRGPAPAGPGKVPGVQPQAPAPGAPPGLPHSFGPEGEPIQGDQTTLPGMPDATGGPPAPAQAPLAPPGAPDILPPFPGDQMSLMEQWKGPGTTPGGQPSPPGAVSVPGAKPPTPFNPIQSPGGTYSKTSAEFNPPEIVRLKNDCYGVAEGVSELHGAGSYRNVPAGSTGEVLSQDESSGWVEVIFPLDESGELEPYHVRCFIEPQDLDHTRVRPPGPFIQRKR